MTALAVVLAIALLAAGAWIVALLGRTSKLTAERDLARERAGDVERNAAQLKDSFRALAGESLQQSSEQFLRLAEQKLSAHQATAVAEMDKRKAVVDQLIAPIGKALEKTQAELQAMEKARTESYSGLRAQVQTMAQQSEQLRGETAKLAQALSSPNIRGRYGEVQLQRVAELSGMQSYCDFDTQATVSTDGKVQRPDMIVRLPNDRLIAVDAKTNIGSYLESLDAKSPEQAEQAMRRFADHVVDQAQALGRKGYWKQFADSPELVVMFVPGDQFLDAALQRRPDLIEMSARANVILASPSTLIGLLRAVNVGWREKKLADSARELLTLGSELHTRFRVAIEHAEGVGGALDRAVREYNQLAGSIDARVMPTLRKFEEAGARKDEPIKELKPIERAVQPIANSASSRALAEPAPPEGK